MELAPDDVLGKYRLVRLLGSGGMGAVWEAHDRDLDRHIALKVLRNTLACDQTASLRMLREARAMARLRHPNVITIFDTATVAGHNLIIMELVEGETMAQWLRRADQDQGHIIECLLAAGAGLVAAHAAGMIHRDFKPHNVLVDRVGRVLVTDFGLARASGPERRSTPTLSAPANQPTDTLADSPDARRRHSSVDETERDDSPIELPEPRSDDPGALDSPLTRTGTVLGTPAYMAPEQAEAMVADERSDQYSFCVTAWEALSGVRPFERVGAALRGAEHVPRRLRPILLRGLARVPAERWPSMEQLLSALSRAWHMPRRLAIAGAVAATACIAGVGLAIFSRTSAAPTTASRTWQPVVVDRPTYEENADAPAISPDGRQLAYASDREGTFRIYVMPLSGGDSRVVSAPGRGYNNPRWMRDGKAILASKITSDANFGDPMIVKIPLDGGPEVPLADGYYADDCGDAIVFGYGNRLVGGIGLRFPEKRFQALFETNIGAAMFPRCDPTGKLVAFSYGPNFSALEVLGDIMIVDRERRVTQLTSDHSSSFPVFTPDGKSIVFSATHDRKTHLYELSIYGGLPRRLTPDGGPAIGADISPDGRTIAVNNDTTAPMPFETSANEPPRMIKSERSHLVRAIPSRDRKQLLAERAYRDGNEIVVIDTQTGETRKLATGKTCFWSHDGIRAFFIGGPLDDTLYSVDVSGGEPTLVAKAPARILFAAAGPDGEHLAVVGSKMIEAWLVTPDGRVTPENIPGLVMPAPDGKWRLVHEQHESRFRLRFVPPGSNLDFAGHDVISDSQIPTWLDDHRVAYAADDKIHILDVITNTATTTSARGHSNDTTVVAVDGEHWFDLQSSPHVSRHLITNFGDRSWR